MKQNQIPLHNGKTVFFDSAKDVFSESTPDWVKNNILFDQKFHQVKAKLSQGEQVKAICWNLPKTHHCNGVIHYAANPNAASSDRLKKLSSSLKSSLLHFQQKLDTIGEHANDLNAAHLTIGHSKGTNIQGLVSEFADFELRQENFALSIDRDSPFRVTTGGYLIVQLQHSDLLMQMHKDFVEYHQQRLKHKGWDLTRFHEVDGENDYEGFRAHVTLGKFDLSALSDSDAQAFIAKVNAWLTRNSNFMLLDSSQPLSFLPAVVTTSSWDQTSSCQFKFYEKIQGSDWARQILPEMPKYDRRPSDTPTRVLSCRYPQRQADQLSCGLSSLSLNSTSLFGNSDSALAAKLHTRVLHENSPLAKKILSLSRLSSTIDHSLTRTLGDAQAMRALRYDLEFAYLFAKEVTVLRLDVGTDGSSGIDTLLAVSDQLKELFQERKYVYLDKAQGTCELHFVGKEIKKAAAKVDEYHHLQSSQVSKRK